MAGRKRGSMQEAPWQWQASSTAHPVYAQQQQGPHRMKRARYSSDERQAAIAWHDQPEPQPQEPAYDNVGSDNSAYEACWQQATGCDSTGNRAHVTSCSMDHMQGAALTIVLPWQRGDVQLPGEEEQLCEAEDSIWDADMFAWLEIPHDDIAAFWEVFDPEILIESLYAYFC